MDAVIVLNTLYYGLISVVWGPFPQVTIFTGGEYQKTMSTSYLGGPIVFGRGDAPSGAIWPLSMQELQEIALMGGSLQLFADDLYGVTVLPEWWTVECDMVVEGECPEWPLAEDNITNGNDLGETIVQIIREIISREEDDWS